jgi:hypothetical protein
VYLRTPGSDIYTLQEHLRHTSVKTTEIPAVPDAGAGSSGQKKKSAALDAGVKVA